MSNPNNISERLWFKDFRDHEQYEAGLIDADEVRRRYKAWVDSGANHTTYPSGRVHTEHGFYVQHGMIYSEASGGAHSLLFGEKERGSSGMFDKLADELEPLPEK